MRKKLCLAVLLIFTACLFALMLTTVVFASIGLFYPFPTNNAAPTIYIGQAIGPTPIRIVASTNPGNASALQIDSQNLPAGLTIQDGAPGPGTRDISGTAEPGTAGAYTSTFTDTGDSFNGTLTITVEAGPQTIVQPDVIKAVGDAGFQLTPHSTNGNGATITGTDAPTYVFGGGDAGIATIDASGNVTIVGQGTTTFTIDSAANASYQAAIQKVVNVTIKPYTPPPPPPVITSANSASVVSGTGGTFQVTATGTAPIAYSLSATAPVTVSIDSATGLITIGAATAAGTHTFTITASNGTLPDATQDFTLTVTTLPGGVTILPGGAVTLPGGVELVFPGGADIAPDGTVTFPGGGNGAVILPGGAKAEIPSGSKINQNTGAITLPSDEDGAVTTPDGAVIKIPGGTVIEPDGTITLPPPDGKCVVQTSDGSVEVDVSGGIKIEPDGTITLTGVNGEKVTITTLGAAGGIKIFLSAGSMFEYDDTYKVSTAAAANGDLCFYIKVGRGGADITYPDGHKESVPKDSVIKVNHDGSIDILSDAPTKKSGGCGTGAGFAGLALLAARACIKRKKSR